MSQRRAFRRVFLPAVWLVIGALIAVSLVKLAFAGGTSDADDDLFPTGEIPAETVFAEKATVENKLTIPGTIKLTESITTDWVRDVTAKGFDGQKLLSQARELIQRYRPKA